MYLMLIYLVFSLWICCFGFLTSYIRITALFRVSSRPWRDLNKIRRNYEGVTSSVATSDVLREISDVWCFGDKFDVERAVVVFHNSSLSRLKISYFLSFFHQFLKSPLHVCLVDVPNWRRSRPNGALRITFYVAHERLFHLVTTLLDSGS